MKHQLAAALLVGFLSISVSHAKEAIRIDASSDAAAEASWKKMTQEAASEKKQKLIIALLQINLAGVGSAYEAAANPELESFGIARVKDRVAGLTADEIIELGNRVSTIKIQQPGE